MIDVTSQIDASQRHVGSRVVEAGVERTAVISQDYDAAVDELWDACTNPERIPLWFLPVSGDLRLGGSYQLEGNAGGTIQRCDPPDGFAATWEYGGDVSWIDVRLGPGSEGRTRLVLEHVAHIDAERWAEFGPGATGVGWELGLMGLALHLTSGEPVDKPAFEAWMASDDGRRFVTLSSELWRDASITAGTDPVEAAGAADRTTAAYTGQPG